MPQNLLVPPPSSLPCFIPCFLISFLYMSGRGESFKLLRSTTQVFQQGGVLVWVDLSLQKELLALLHGVLGRGHRVSDCPGRLENLVVVATLEKAGNNNFVRGGRDSETADRFDMRITHTHIHTHRKCGRTFVLPSVNM